MLTLSGAACSPHARPMGPAAQTIAPAGPHREHGVRTPLPTLTASGQSTHPPHQPQTASQADRQAAKHSSGASPNSGPILQAVRAIEMDADTWLPGHHLAKSLSKVVAYSAYLMRETPFGLSATGSALLGGYLRPHEELSVTRRLGHEHNYLLFAAASQGDANIDLYVTDAQGRVVARDTEPDAQPLVRFQPQTTADYTIHVRGATEVQTFITLGMGSENGYYVPAAQMQTVFQRVLNKSAYISKDMAKRGLGGATFHDSPGNWALHGTVLRPRESVRQGNVNVGAGYPTIFIAEAHDRSLDLDITVRNTLGQTFRDVERDAEPVVALRPNQRPRSYSFEISLPQAQERALAVGVVLRTQHASQARSQMALAAP